MSIPLLIRERLFSPFDLPGDLTWLKSDSGITSAGLGVSNWRDSGPNGHDATQGTDLDRPLFVPNSQNGLPVLRFDRSNTEFMTTTGMNFTGVFHVCVAGLTRSQSLSVLLGAAVDANPKFGSLLGWITSSDFRTQSQTDSLVTDVTPIGDGVFQVFEVKRDAANNIELIVDGITQVSGVVTGDVDFNNLAKRNNSISTLFGDVDIGEIIATDTVLTDTEINNLREYMKRWFGFSFIVDESGNSIIDENGNLIIG